MVEFLNEIVVDGAMLEGGGQLFRMTIAMAYLFNRSIRIENIRANREKGGGGLKN